MNQKMAVYLAVCLVSVGVITLFPTSAAQPYGGSVSVGTGDDPPIIKDYFDLWDNVYYYVVATDDGAPLQYKDIYIEIVSPTGTPVYWDTITTDEFGKAQGYWWGTGTPDKYTIYANYTSVELSNTTFRVYDPIPDSALVTTYTNNQRTNGGTPALYFNSDDTVFFSIFVEDQFGNPFKNDRWVYTKVEHNDESHSRGYWTEWTDDDAYIDELYYPWSDFSGDELFGTYRINVTNEIDETIGEATFIVVDVDIHITPDKSQYIQGDKINIVVETSIDDTIDVRIIDFDGDDLSSANWTDQAVNNDQWTKEYTLSSNLPDGEYRIQVLKDNNLMDEEKITLRKFNLNVWTDNGAYLPGETMKVFYTITNNKDGSGVIDAQLQWIFQYYDIDNDVWDSSKDTLTAPGSQGSFTVSIPKSANKIYDGSLWMWANDTRDHSSYKFRDIEIGSIDASVNVQQDIYIPGDFVGVKIESHLNGDNLRYANVAFTVSKDGQEISSYTKNNLNTDVQGDLNYIFVLPGNAEAGFYTVSINVTKDGTNEWDIASDSFEVVSERKMSIELAFDNKHYIPGNKPVYYSGDTVTVTYTVYKADQLITGLNCAYSVDYYDSIIAVGLTTSGQFTFNIPSDFEGTISVNLECTDAQGVKVAEDADIEVVGTGLLLNPSTNQYKPGDTIKVDYSVVGKDVPNALYYFEVWDGSGNIIKRENVAASTGVYKFTVPKGNPPDTYYIVGTITESSGVILTSDFVELTKLKGYMLTFSLDKNTYRPGETATLSYKVVSLDGSDIPEKFTLTYYFFGYPQRTTEVSKPEGDLRIKVPEDAVDGEGFFYLSTNDFPASTAKQQADIRESPNPLAETVGDLSLMEILLLIFVLIALLFGIGGWMKGKKALDEAKLPPWKKEGPLPEPEKFKDTQSEPVPEQESPGPVGEDSRSFGDQESGPPEDTGTEPL